MRKTIARLSATMLALLCFFLNTFAQDRAVSGTVKDPTGAGVAGVTVAIKGTNRATQTDATGTFTINASESQTLVFTGVGYATQEIAATNATVDVVLQTSAANLNEVVVVGYGTARRKDITGSVATITSKNFNQGVITAPDQLLQNKIPGVDITQNSGQPGAATTVKIRGNNSIRAGGNPLYVVDGIPLDGRTARPSLGDVGFGITPESNPLIYINPADIERIDILKDASSAAIYGSRGANGVVVITTRKGAVGAPKIDAGVSFGVSGYMRKYEVLSASQYRSALTKYALDTFKYDKGASVDALDAIRNKNLTQNYNVAFGGGTETGRFRASFLGSSTQGLLKKSSLDRYLGSFNGNYRFLDKKLSIDFGLIAGHYTENLTNITNNSGSEGNLLSAALIWNPTVPFRDNKGLYNLNSNGVGNPLAISDAYSDVSNVNAFLLNASAGYKILKNLEYRFLYGLNHSTGERLFNVEGFLQGFPAISGKGRADIANATLTSQTITHTLNYRANLSQAFTLDAVAGYEYWKSTYANGSILATGFNTNLDQSNRTKIPYTSILQDANTQNLYTPYVDPKTELQSVFARANFSLLDRYSLTATIRADGSSKFGKNNRYGYFPSVGVRWNIYNESFMKGSTLFSALALRATYGVTGNQDFPAGSSQEQFNLAAYNNAPQAIVANPDLKWEETRSYNFGLDYAFTRGKIFGSIDYYHKNTTNILFQATAIQPAPSSIYFINLPANIINSGVEFGLGATLIDRKDLSWDFSFNVAYNKNILKNFYDVKTGLPLTILTGGISGQGVSGTLAQVITNNQPVNEFYLKPFAGFDAGGNPVDTKGNPISNATPEYAGDPNPHVIGGFGTNVQFHKFYFTLNAGGAFGYKIYNNTATSVTNINNITSGRNIDLAAYNSAESKSSGAVASTRFLESGNYVKLRNASLRYNIGDVGRFVKALNVYVSGTNLFVITKFHGFDPEVNVDKSNNAYPSRSIEYIPYPTPRTILFGLNFSL